jgi:hypothetical protein
MIDEKPKITALRSVVENSIYKTDYIKYCGSTIKGKTESSWEK